MGHLCIALIQGGCWTTNYNSLVYTYCSKATYTLCISRYVYDHPDHKEIGENYKVMCVLYGLYMMHLQEWIHQFLHTYLGIYQLDRAHIQYNSHVHGSLFPPFHDHPASPNKADCVLSAYGFHPPGGLLSSDARLLPPPSSFSPQIPQEQTVSNEFKLAVVLL